jgi:glutathione peroxidase
MNTVILKYYGIIIMKVGDYMSIYDLKVKNRNNEEVSLSEFKGKVLLIVNTATGCGFTPQYEGLEKIYKTYHDKGLEILDFPCNQFGNQAPGTDDEIHEFCTFKYNTSFDQFTKIEVNGENESPLYTLLKNAINDDIIAGMKNKMAMKAIEKISKTYKEKKDIKWNFTKFLIDKDGNVVGRYSPTYKPEDMEDKIKELI